MRDKLVSSETGHAIVKCRDCMKVGRIDYTLITETTAFNGRPNYTSILEVAGKQQWLSVSNTMDRELFKHAVHGNCDTRKIKVSRVKGHFVADKPCDGRCMGAIGPNCECSCAGKNHGGGHSAW